MTADSNVPLPATSYLDSPALYRYLRQATRALAFPDFTAAAADPLHDRAAELSLTIPKLKMDPAERQLLRSYTFYGSTAVADIVGRALQDEECFPGAAAVGTALRDRAARATVLRGVSGALKDLAQRLDDLVIYDLGTATREAIALSKAITTDVAFRDPPTSNLLRFYRLGTARRMLDGRRGIYRSLAGTMADRSERPRPPSRNPREFAAFLMEFALRFTRDSPPQPPGSPPQESPPAPASLQPEPSPAATPPEPESPPSTPPQPEEGPSTAS